MPVQKNHLQVFQSETDELNQLYTQFVSIINGNTIHTCDGLNSKPLKEDHKICLSKLYPYLRHLCNLDNTMA
jgi:hypothetical protein